MADPILTMSNEAGAKVRSAAAIALLGLVTLTTPAMAESWTFDGRIEASATANVMTLIDGVIGAVYVRAGDEVRAGDLLFEITSVDNTEATILSAEAEVAARQAELADKQLVLDQQRRLRERQVASDLAYRQALHAVEIAEAQLAAAQVRHDAAKSRHGLRQLKAPIDGIVSAPNLPLGAFMEAEAGAPLTTIRQLDPINVVYKVPYAERLEAMSEAGVDTVDALLERIETKVILPHGASHPHPGAPFAADTTLDVNGDLTVYARVPNPERLLLPGLVVTVQSTLKPAS